MKDFKTQLQAYIDDIEAAIDELLPKITSRPEILHEAMHYCMRAGGKRLRPVLLLAAAEMTGVNPKDALPAAVAVECLHAYSLIHDDLPCMDNSPLRRGRPSCHVQFGETVALLAGDALLTEAFRLLAVHYHGKPALGMSLSSALADAASSRKMIGGQVFDTLAEGQALDVDQLREIHLGKTAALITASLKMGVMHGSDKWDELDCITRAGLEIGLAFQIVDDVLDATSDSATLGKQAGLDAERGKVTYASLVGIDEARSVARELSEEAVQELSRWGDKSEFLRSLVLDMASRVS
ncbi:MAG: polyprenyl synthetase family protein [Opitutales bacterium]|nr:polyprenyl synthetase family protein [Opitutales bacterium]